MADFIYDSPKEHARFFTIVQNDISRWFLSFWTSSSFFIILNELLGEEESLVVVGGIK
jgi:hypothetical protein